MYIEEHWFDTAEKIHCENFDSRPDSNDISLIVIHCISLPPGKFGGDSIHRLFQNQLDPTEHPYFEKIHTLRVSAHVLIDRCGKVFQYVPFSKRAWHAGESSYQNRSNCNDFSIGIELEGTDNCTYEKEQYAQLAKLTKVLIEHYPLLCPEHITGHSTIAPGRKTDPGNYFDWSIFNKLISE